MRPRWRRLWERARDRSNAAPASSLLRRGPRHPRSASQRTVAEIESVYVASAERSGAAAVLARVSVRASGARGPRLDIRPATPDDRDEIIALLRRSLGSDGDPRYPELFAWKHDENRVRPVADVGGDDRDRIVAFRALMRWEFVRGGAVLRAVRAVDTATDPDYQGRGSVPGAHDARARARSAPRASTSCSTHRTRRADPGISRWGGVRSVDFRRRCDSWVRLERCSVAFTVPADRWSQPLTIGDVGRRRGLAAARAVTVAGRVRPTWRELRTNLDEEFLAWRFGTPLLGYRVVDDGDAAIICRSRRRGSALELAVVAVVRSARFGRSTRRSSAARRPARLRRSASAGPDVVVVRAAAGRWPGAHLAGGERSRRASARQLGADARRRRVVLKSSRSAVGWTMCSGSCSGVGESPERRRPAA